MTDLEQRDSEVLDSLLKEFPIASTPFAIIGQMVDMSEKEVIKRALRLRHSGALRPIQIRWDPRGLGCNVALVIASAQEAELERAVEAINRHPGVSQNYQRNHEFNLWFTLCLPSYSRLGLDATVHAIAEEAGIERIHVLPAIRSYREGQLDSNGETAGVTPDEVSQRRIRLLQDELPIQPRPFDPIARKLNESPDDLIDFIREQKELGTISRIGPVPAMPKGRFAASSMGVWKVPEERLEQVAITFSEDESVSSSTIRESREDWPYNLFTIIQGRSVDECENTMERLGQMANLSDYEALFPLQEYKQTRMALFPPELADWEQKHLEDSSHTAAS